MTDKWTQRERGDNLWLRWMIHVDQINSLGMGILHPPCVFDAAETQHLSTAKTKCALTPDLLMTNNLIVKQFCQTPFWRQYDQHHRPWASIIMSAITCKEIIGENWLEIEFDNINRIWNVLCLIRPQNDVGDGWFVSWSNNSLRISLRDFNPTLRWLSYSQVQRRV